MHSRLIKFLPVAAAVLGLAACGGGDDGDGGGATPTPTPTPPAATSKFTQNATWKVVLPATGQSVCYDFDAKAEAACTGTAWDVKLVSGGRSANLYTNSGASGTGAGGAFGSPFAHTWTDLLKWNDALIDPTGGAIPATLYAADTAKSVFSGSNEIQAAAFEYNLTGTHQLAPNFRVFLLTTNSASADITGAAGPVFALQVTGYYGGPTGTASGWPSFRWVNLANSAVVNTASVDATGGWVYYDLASKAVSTEAGTWHIAFNRYNVKLNGGTSGRGTVAGFLSKTPAGFYAADGKTPVAAKFNSTSNLADTLPDLVGAPTGPTAAAGWVKDDIGSQLTPAYTGTYPNAMNFGWYSYYPTEAAAAPAGLGQHQLKANPEAGSLIKSGEGTSYARMHLTNIAYAAATPAYAGAQTWTFEFGIQPAGAR